MTLKHLKGEEDIHPGRLFRPGRLFGTQEYVSNKRAVGNKRAGLNFSEILIIVQGGTFLKNK